VWNQISSESRASINELKFEIHRLSTAQSLANEKIAAIENVLLRVERMLASGTSTAASYPNHQSSTPNRSTIAQRPNFTSHEHENDSHFSRTSSLAPPHNSVTQTRHPQQSPQHEPKRQTSFSQHRDPDPYPIYSYTDPHQRYDS
jgi:hypothetical protein